MYKLSNNQTYDNAVRITFGENSYRTDPQVSTWRGQVSTWNPQPDTANKTAPAAAQYTDDRT